MMSRSMELPDLFYYAEDLEIRYSYQQLAGRLIAGIDDQTSDKTFRLRAALRLLMNNPTYDCLILINGYLDIGVLHGRNGDGPDRGKHEIAGLDTRKT